MYKNYKMCFYYLYRTKDYQITNFILHYLYSALHNETLKIAED